MHAAIETQGQPALELSRYGLGFRGPETLVIGISWSGSTSRTIEVLDLARQRGCATLAITNRTERKIASVADQTLTLQVEDIEPNVPGTRSYTATLVGLFLIALELGTRRGVLSSAAADDFLHTLAGTADRMEQTIAFGQDTIPTLLEELGDAPVEIFAGGGPSYAAALYAVGKMQEAGAINAHGQELEEWAHVQMHATTPGMRPIVVAPPGRSRERAEEIARAMTALGAQTVIFGAASDIGLRAAGRLIPVAGDGLPEEFSPLVYSVPIQLYAHHTAIRYGPMVRRIAFDQNFRETNHRLILESRLATSYPPLADPGPTAVAGAGVRFAAGE
jgi:glucosamine--fructose-6-phosphate aminotransferase (isomerizing)